MQNNKLNKLKQLMAVMVLAIFSLAITPWSVLHQHEEPVQVVEKNCKHTVHVKSSAEHCLICKAHFEKSYTRAAQSYFVELKTYIIKRVFLLFATPFNQIIATQLRGPPALS